jgi:hypothetical protein
MRVYAGSWEHENKRFGNVKCLEFLDDLAELWASEEKLCFVESIVDQGMIFTILFDGNARNFFKSVLYISWKNEYYWGNY